MKNLILTTSILFLTVFSSRGYTQCLPVNNFGEYINILRQPKNSYFKKVKNEIDKKTLSTSDLERDFPEMFKKKRDEIITVVGITFDKNGQLRKAVILKKSLFNNFDDQALKAVRAVPRYPKPPKDMLQSDQFVHLAKVFFVPPMEAWGKYINVTDPSYSYFLRIKNKLKKIWNPMPILREGMQIKNIWEREKIETVVGFSIDQNGHLKDVGILKESFLGSFDDESVRTVKALGVYPKPPKTILKENNQAHMAWHFVVCGLNEI